MRISSHRTSLCNTLLLVGLALALLLPLAMTRPALAQSGETGLGVNDDAAASGSTTPAETKTCGTATGQQPCLDTSSTVFKPLGDVTIPQIIGKAINGIIGLTGVIALVMFIYGGISWMIAGGNTEKVSKAKNTLVWAVLGLVMVFAAYAIVNFVISAIT